MKYDIAIALNEWTTLEHILQTDVLELYEEFEEKLWIDDSVTVNRSGSYTFNSWKAKQYVLDNIELLKEAKDNFGLESEHICNKILNKKWEYLDVIIRCYILCECFYRVIETIKENETMTPIRWK